MSKMDVLNRLINCGVVAVVRAENEEQAKKIAEACIKAGIVVLRSHLQCLVL